MLSDEEIEAAIGFRLYEYQCDTIRNFIDRAIEAAVLAKLQAQSEPFIKHEGSDDGWSDWVCPDPESYLMKCCDCGLVHEAQFKVVRYKSESEREDCDQVDDQNLQAVFRMRRSDQWEPTDTAHRAGGMPMDDIPAPVQQVCINGLTEAETDASASVAGLTVRQDVNQQLLEALRWALEWIDAVPKGTVLPTMPGFDRDYVDTLISKAGKQ